MNTYDFDKTLYYPDSSYKFIMYCTKKYPVILRRLPKTAWTALKYALKIVDTKAFKEQAFSFLQDLPDVDRDISDFWEINFPKIHPWYLEQKRSDDIIISASPEFLLKPVCEKLGVRLIATRMDKKTGKMDGLNCHDREKVRRFYEEYPNAHTENFYSDSFADTPMAEIADRAYMVKKEKIIDWPKKA